MRYVSMGMILLIATAWILGAGAALYQGIRTIRTWRGPVAILVGLLALFGVAGFFGAAFSSMGGLDWLGSYEWPIGYTSDVVRTPDGKYIVPHTPSGRVQVYDANLHFLRGWRIDSSGGTFTLRMTSDGNIDIYAARGARHSIYDINGRLLSQSMYSPRADLSPLDTPPNAISVWVPTRWWLWPLTGPFYAWFCAVAGLLIWSRVCRDRPKREFYSPPSRLRRRAEE